MRKIFITCILCFLVSGCTAMNKGLDRANEGVYKAGKPVGKVLNLPNSASEGAAEGMITSEYDDNPFNR